MKNKTNNRKRYLGNALSNAFFPVIASLGLTLGVTSLVVSTKKTNTGSGEEAKSHDIIVPSVEEKGWKIKCENSEGKVISKAKKDESVTFTAFKTSESNLLDQPTGIMINGASYKLDDNMQAVVVIKFVETMNVSLVFPSLQDEHIVTFHMNDQAQTQTQMIVKDGQIVAKPHDPVRQYYKFNGWHTDPEQDTPYLFNEPLTSETLDLYAHWTDTGERTVCTITLPPTTEGWTLTGETSVKIGDQITFTATKTTSNADPIKRLRSLIFTADGEEPQTFVVTSWTKLYTECDIKVVIPFNKDMSIQMEFDDIPEDTYTVTFDANGGSFVESQSIQKGDTILESPSTNWDGHQFNGWYNGTTKWEFGPSGTGTPVSDNIILKASWTAEKHQATFICTNGEPASQAQQVAVGSMPVNPTTPKKTSVGFKHVFKGWSTKEKAEQPSDIGIEPMGLSDVTYYAQWTDIRETYQVTFDLNGGTTETPIQPQVVQYESTIETVDEPTKEHCTFDGWYDGKGNKWTLGEGGNKVTSDVTLYAKWIVTDKYTIKFVDEDGTQLSIQENVEHGTFPTVPSDPEKTKYGYTSKFKEWENKGITDPGKYKGVIPAEADATYTAVYEYTPKQVLVEFDAGESTSTYEPRIVKFGETIGSLTDPVAPSNKSFYGWYRDEAKTWIWVPETQKVDTEDSIKLRAGFIDSKADEPASSFETDTTTEEVTGLVSFNKYKSTNTDIRVPSHDKDGNLITALWKTFHKPKDGTWCTASMTSVILPPSITYLLNNTFAEQTSLTSVKFPNIKYLGSHCLNNTNIGSFTIYDLLEHMDQAVFVNNPSLTTINCIHWPGYQGTNKLELDTKVGMQFHNCQKLQYVTLPARLTTLGPSMFNKCPKLTEITFEGTKDQWLALTTEEEQGVTTWRTTWRHGSSIEKVKGEGWEITYP